MGRIGSRWRRCGRRWRRRRSRGAAATAPSTTSWSCSRDSTYILPGRGHRSGSRGSSRRARISAHKGRSSEWVGSAHRSRWRPGAPKCSRVRPGAARPPPARPPSACRRGRDRLPTAPPKPRPHGLSPCCFSAGWRMTGRPRSARPPGCGGAAAALRGPRSRSPRCPRPRVTHTHQRAPAARWRDPSPTEGAEHAPRRWGILAAIQGPQGPCA
jgi:hypothetical protein